MRFRIRKSGWHAHHGKPCLFPQYTDSVWPFGDWEDMSLPYRCDINREGLATMEEARALIEDFKARNKAAIEYNRKVRDTYLKP